MFRFRRAIAATAGMVLAGTILTQGAAHAAVIACDFTVTPDGNGMQALDSNGAPVATLHTGDVDNLFNTITIRNNIRYWTDGPDWYPIINLTSGVIYMARVSGTCENISQ
jgi:hypothetical protein